MSSEKSAIRHIGVPIISMGEASLEIAGYLLNRSYDHFRGTARLGYAINPEKIGFGKPRTSAKHSPKCQLSTNKGTIYGD